jgi:transposase
MRLTEKCLTGFQRKLLQKQLEKGLSDTYRQRLEIMLLTDSGKSQAEICKQLGCSAATASHWIHIARLGIAHQWQDCPLGRPKSVEDDYVEMLQKLLQHSPRDYGYSFCRWTVKWLSKHLEKELGVGISERHLKRIMKSLGLSTIDKTTNNSNPKEANLDKEKSSSSRIIIADI